MRVSENDWEGKLITASLNKTNQSSLFEDFDTALVESLHWFGSRQFAYLSCEGLMFLKEGNLVKFCNLLRARFDCEIEILGIKRDDFGYFKSSLVHRITKGPPKAAYSHEFWNSLTVSIESKLNYCNKVSGMKTNLVMLHHLDEIIEDDCRYHLGKQALKKGIKKNASVPIEYLHYFIFAEKKYNWSRKEKRILRYFIYIIDKIFMTDKKYVSLNQNWLHSTVQKRLGEPAYVNEFTYVELTEQFGFNIYKRLIMITLIKVIEFCKRLF